MKEAGSAARSKDNLRRIAENRLRSDVTGPLPPTAEADTVALLHELQVHQIELEMQNEELRRAQAELLTAGTRYRDLYDFGPVAYLTLDLMGHVLEANLAGATLLGIGRHHLTNRRFASFLSPDFQAIYRSFLERLQETGVRQTCELCLQHSEGTLRTLQAEAVLAEWDGAQESGRQIRLAIIDVTERKRAEQEQRAAVLRERNRIAQDIHDTLAQGLTGILVQLEAAAYAPEQEQAQEHVSRARDLARNCLQEARRTARALRPRALDGKNLAAALADLVARTIVIVAMRIQFHVHGSPRLLADEAEDHLLRIGQEALTNTIKHSDAAEIHIDLYFEPARVRLCVRDDGKGFDVRPGFREDSLGIHIMYERAEQIGARMKLTSSPGQGTSITVTMPTPPPQAEKSRP